MKGASGTVTVVASALLAASAGIAYAQGGGGGGGGGAGDGGAGARQAAARPDQAAGRACRRARAPASTARPRRDLSRSQAPAQRMNNGTMSNGPGATSSSAQRF